MYPYMNEDVAFERLKDLQREMESSRRVGRLLSNLATVARILAARAWWLGGLAFQRPPRPHPSWIKENYDQESTPEVA